MASLKDDFVGRGGLLHKFSVVDDKNQPSFLSGLLDDALGLPSRRILNHIICKNEYEKDLAKVVRLESFRFLCYSKEKEYRRISDYLRYLEQRGKAAKVMLDNAGTIGFMVKDEPAPDGVPCIRCYYHTAGQPEHQQAPVSSGDDAVLGKRPAPAGDGPAEAKRPRPPAVAAPARVGFHYMPPEAAGELSTKPPEFYDPAAVAQGEADNGCSCPLPHPSSLPRATTDGRFRYVPPDPTGGVKVRARHSEVGGLQQEGRDGLDQEPTPMIIDYESLATSLPATIGVVYGDGVVGSAGGGIGGGQVGVLAVAKGKAQAEAAAHYNQLRRDKRSRNESIIYHMRRLNNWVKAQLINELQPAHPDSQELEILDLACGKGGDFPKWRGIGNRFPIARYVGVDIARSSLEDAIGRYMGDQHIRRALGPAVSLACADLGSDDLIRDEVEVWDALDQTWERRSLLHEEELFDAVSMQFALHYMFESEERATTFFRAVSRHLRPGGSFIATTVDARVFVEMLSAYAEYDDSTGNHVARFTDGDQRELCRLQVDARTYSQLFREDPAMPIPDYGLEYRFLLKEGGDDEGSAAVNAPEWLVPPTVLRRLAADCGMELEYAQNFHELIESRKHDSMGSGKGGQGIQWRNHRGTISEPEWELARIYVALKFRKKGPEPEAPPPPMVLDVPAPPPPRGRGRGRRGGKK